MKATLPLGPFDSAVRAPFTFEFELERSCVVGTRMLPTEARRVIELGFRGIKPLEGLSLSERICHRSVIAHSYSFCQAVEDALGVEVAAEQSAGRALLAECERMAAHLEVLSDLGRSLEDEMVYGGTWRYASRIRDVFRRASGNPFGFGTVVPGGVRFRGDGAAPREVGGFERALRRETSLWRRKIMFSRRRLAGACLRADGGSGDHRTSPVFRAGGSALDLRCGGTAYGFYRTASFEPVSRDGGESIDRALVLLDEINASLDIIGEILDGFDTAAGEPEEVAFRQGNGYGACEGPEGAVEHTVFLASEGTIISDRIRCAAEVVAGAAAGALRGIRYEDVVPAIISLYLCHACTER